MLLSRNKLFLNLSPVVDEKAKEEEAYRQIKIKMRAEQLLADSDLPASMKRHAIHYTGRPFISSFTFDVMKRRTTYV
jgi:hypothetical protein